MKYSPFLHIVIIAIAFGYAFFLYRKDALLEDVKASLKWLMAILRFFAMWIILFLLLGIIVENLIERKEKPIVFVAHDNSESIVLTKDSTYYRTTYLDELKSTAEQLRESFEVIEYSFSDFLDGGLKAQYTGKTTDIAKVFNQIFDQYSNRNIGAIILSTDGIYNTGSNPIYSISQRSFIPIYTVGLGDTNLVRDVKVDIVNHNDIAFLGNEFPVEIAFSGIKTIGEKVQVAIYQNEKLVTKQEHVFKSDYEQNKLLFNLRAQGIGYQKYTAQISTVSNEFTVKNNTLTFYIEVIDGRQKILIAHQAPHPDVAALRYVMENNQDYEIEVKDFKEVTSVNEYDLIVVHNYNPESKIIDDAVGAGTVPFLFINGLATDMRSLQKLKIGFTGSGNSDEEVGFAHNVGFKDILLSPKIIQTFSSAPPLHSPFGNYVYSDALDILAFQKVGNIQLDNPLIYFTTKENSKIGVIMGEGVWRWRLHDQLRNLTTSNFEELIGKLVTYLAVKENKDPFKVNIENEYSEGDEVIVKAELYNKSYELINEPEVKFNLIDEAGIVFESALLKTTNAYEKSLGRLPFGLYSWEAKTTFQDKNYSKKGTFLVKEVKLEWLNTTADHRLLRNISQNSNGKFYFPSQLSQLTEEIKKSKDLVTVVYPEKSYDDLIDFKWLFFAIILFISAEWFFRKYHGAY